MSARHKGDSGSSTAARARRPSNRAFLFGGHDAIAYPPVSTTGSARQSGSVLARGTAIVAAATSRLEWAPTKPDVRLSRTADCRRRRSPNYSKIEPRRARRPAADTLTCMVGRTWPPPPQIDQKELRKNAAVSNMRAFGVATLCERQVAGARRCSPISTRIGRLAGAAMFASARSPCRRNGRGAKGSVAAARTGQRFGPPISPIF